MADRWIRFVVALISVILIAPVLVVLILSFSGDPYLRFPPNSVSLRWYETFLGNPEWRRSLIASLSIGLMTSLISTVIGFLAAYALVRGRMAGKRIMLSFVLLPLIVPHVITAIALYFVSAPLGLVGSRFWIAVSHSVVAAPIVVLILMSTLQGVDPNLERAAFGLGASRVIVFRRIVLPLIVPGILSAALFSFLASFDELIIALFLSGVSSETLPVRIWNSLRMDVEPTIAAVSAFLIGVTVFVLLIDAAARRMLSVGRAAPTR
ncbi:MAG: ABC transporter permease [Geminicoccaceae bacterium]|nr:ABC transporter permease [Geminicoccaceae bacterium]